MSKTVLDIRYIYSPKPFQNIVRWFYYHPHFIEKRTEAAQRSHATNLAKLTKLESCRAGIEPRPEPVHCCAILLLSMVVAQQMASLPRVNTDDLVFYPRT